MARGVDFGLGLWLVAAAFLLAGPGEAARVADLGAGLALLGIAVLAPPGTRAGFAAIVLGSWVMLAPLFLSYPRVANAANDVLTGLAIVAMTLHPRAGEKWLAGRPWLRPRARAEA